MPVASYVTVHSSYVDDEPPAARRHPSAHYRHGKDSAEGQTFSGRSQHAAQSGAVMHIAAVERTRLPQITAAGFNRMYFSYTPRWHVKYRPCWALFGASPVDAGAMLGRRDAVPETCGRLHTRNRLL